MARVAYVMDGIMGRLGLSGRAFIPMILGFGCSVPAIMASRALENRRDRYKTMLITPFMSCSARLPIYVLFSEMFFADHAMLAAYSMYVLGLVVAVLCAFVMGLLERGRKRQGNALLIELPEYKAPSAHTIFIYVWEKVKDYLWPLRLYRRRHGRHLRLAAGQGADTLLRAGGPRLLADCGGADRGGVCQRSSGFQLRGAVQRE